MDFRINEEQRAFVDAVRRVCQNDFKSRAARDLDGTWPAKDMQQLAELGVLGMSVPREYGGRDWASSTPCSRWKRSARSAT